MPRSFEEWEKEYEKYGGARRQTSAPSSNASPFGQILKPQFMVDPNNQGGFFPRNTMPSQTRHPYADYMTQWNAVKADAANMGLADSYGMPLQQYYALKGKPDWMIQADAADYQRTLMENPAAPAKRPSAYGLGNIDLNNRPVVADPDGGYATVRSMSFYDDDTRKETLIPTVVGSKIVGDQEAINNYYRTGEYLGRFGTPTEATAYALRLHSDQDKLYTGGEGISSVRADVDADKHEAISNRDYAKYAQMMQQMPALEQWFGQFANDLTASYYKDQQQQYQPAAAATPTSERKLDEMYDRTPTKASQIAMQYEMERDGIYPSRESAVNAPTDQVLKNYVSEMRKKLDGLLASGDTRSQEYKTTLREVKSGEKQLLRFRPDYVQFDQESPDSMRKNAGAINAPRADVALKDPQYAMINYIDRIPNTKDGIDITQFVKAKFPQGSVEEQAAYPAIAMVQDFDLDKIYTHMSNSEKGIYNTVYHTEGKEKADEYLRSIYKELAYRQNIELQQDFSEYAKAHPFNATMASIGITPFQGLGVLGGLEQLVGGEYYTPYSGVYGPTVAKETIRGTVTKDMNPLEQTLYGAGTSVGDMLSLLVAFGPYGGRVGLPAASYTSSQRESALKGANGLQSNIVAAGDAAVEAITETIGWNRLRGLFEKGDLLKYGFKHVIKQIAQNGLFEGLEEMPGPTAHLFLDSVFMGANSEYNRRLSAMGGSGAMSEEVKDGMFKDVFSETLQGFGGGFLAGGVMSGGADVSGSIANSQQVESVQKQLMTENPWMSNETALQIAQQRTGMTPLNIDVYEKAGKEYEQSGIGEELDATTSPVDVPAPEVAQMDTGAQTEPVRPVTEPQDTESSNPFTVPAEESYFDSSKTYDPEEYPRPLSTRGITVSGFLTVGDSATVKTDGGNVKLEDVQITNPVMSALYTYARSFNDAESANTFLGFYPKSGAGASTYIKAYNEYYKAGLIGNGTVKVDSSVYGQLISPEARSIAYEMGRQDRVKLSEKAWGSFPVEVKDDYSGVVKSYTGAVSKENRAKLLVMDKAAKTYGVQIIVVDKMGKANGMYAGGNKVYVAMDAIDGGITKAASHELLHYVKGKDEAAYTELQNIVLESVGDAGAISARIKAEIDRHAAAGITLTEAQAMEEIVADALPDVILSEKNAQRLADENPGLFQRILDWLREFMAKWNETFKGSPEAEALAKNGKAYQDALELFERTLYNSKTNETAQESNGVAMSLMTDGKPLTEKQFYARYGRHTLLRGNVEETLRSIRENGFKSGGFNTLPAQVGYDGKGEPDITLRKYPVKAGDTILLVPYAQIDNRGKIKDGWKPKDYEVVKVEYDWQPLYELYKKGFEQADGIRYSLKSTIPSDADALQQENAKLRAAVDDLKAQFQLTEGRKLNIRKVEELAAQILRENQSRYNKQNLTDNLNTVFEFIANTDGINWHEIMTATTDIAKAVLMESRQVNDEMYVANADLRKHLRTTPISLTSTQKAEVARMFDGANNFRKKLLGSVRITNDGTPLDVAWQELNEKYGEFFPADINEGDMPAHLMDVVNSLQPTVENPFGMNMEEAAADLALRIYDEYFDIPEVKTFADKKADELQRVKVKYRNRITEIREGYKERMQAQKQRMKDAYAQRDARKEETATRNGYINQIKRIAGELSERLLANTDKSNVPEGMKKAVLSMLQSLDFVTDRTGERMATKFALLQNEYQKLRDGGLNSETTLAGVYDEDVNDMLETLVEITSNKSVSDLETEELELVRNVVRMIQHMVATENKLFAQARKETVTDMGQKSIQWLYQQKSKKEWGKVTRIIQTMLTENTLNAETFFAQFEGTPIHELYVSLRDGLDTHILNNKQTEDYLKQAMKDYGYKEWSKSAKQTLQTESGGVLELSIDEMLTLYATFKREGLTKTNHILGGGVTIKDAQTRIPTKLTKGDMAKLESMLTDQQRAYADHMVKYLSTVGAEWGNEVSMKLNGFKKFNEKYYIPFRTNEDYTKKAPGQMGDIRLKAGSFTKSLTKRANTPIVIEPFTQLWAQHAEQMSMYNAFALPIEDMTRVWNYRDAEDRASSVKNAISSAFTRTGNDYIRNFLTDLNGGAITPVGQGLFDKLISITKRGSVSANLSVAIQQMSAGVRAMAEIDPKYFIPGSVKGVRYRRSYAELLKWSPTAQLKQWGYFDTSMTRTIYERAKGGPMQWIQDKASWAAQQGDMLNWAQIWEAVKLETKANTDLQGDAILEASARRFRDVIDRTQVVDSIFHRTEWARSKSGLVKLATAFKSEPMMMYNMLFRAKMAAANGNKGRAARYVSGVVSSMILNAALAAIVAGFRDRKNEKKDEKGNIIGVRTYEDKYVDAFMDKLVDAPMSIIPILSDVYSMWQGYSSDRLDMQPLEKFVNAAKAIVDGEKTWAEKFPKVVDFISMATGIPAFNVYRDTNALYQGVYEMLNQNTLKGAAYDVTLPISVRLQAAIANDPIKKPGRQSLNTGIYYDMLTLAKMQGMENDVAAIEAELMRNGISESSIDSTLKERIRQAEPLVREAAKLLLSGKVSEYSATVGKIEAAGYDREIAVEMAKAEATYIENAARKYMSMDDFESKDAYLKDMEKRGYSKAYLDQVYASLPEKEAGEDPAETLYRYSTLTNALESGNDHDIRMVLDQFVSEGKSMSTIRAQVTKEFKPIYYAAHLRGDTAAMKRIETTLTKYLPYKNERKENDFKDWLSDSYYSDLYTLIDNGSATSAARLRKDMADKRIDNLGDIRNRLKTYYSARYKELLAYDKAAAAKLKATLVSLSFSPEMIDNWARKRN